MAKTASRIHDAILEKIGADLSVILKTKAQLSVAVEQNPFHESFDSSRIHLVFTNHQIDTAKVRFIEDTIFAGEVFQVGQECFYLYLPRDADKKVLNTNYLERRLGIVATTRKLSVVKHLACM